MTGQNRALDGARRDEVLVEAASRRAPIVLSCRGEGGWVNLKSRFLAAVGPGQHLVVEYPAGDQGQRAPDIGQGQHVGVSFRRGHHKCVFDSVVTGKERFAVSQHHPVGALVIRWPAELCSLQRRTYFRVAVPGGQSVAVYLWPGGAESRQRAGSSGWPLWVGRLVDLSAGGFRVELASEDDPQCAIGQRVGMEFVPEANRPPIVADAKVRHRQVVGEGRIGLGFQFIGLEQSPRGRVLLERLGRITAGWRRVQVGGGART